MVLVLTLLRSHWIVNASTIDLSGSGASLISGGIDISASTIIGGAGADTINLGSGQTSVRVIGGAGNDTFTIDGLLLAPQSLVVLVMTASTWLLPLFLVPVVAASNTYFFGSGGGKDTINFGSLQTASFSVGTIAFTVAVDSTYGATSGYSFLGSSGKLSFGNDSNYLTINGLTGSSSNSPGALGITFTTVSTSVITALG